MALTVGGLKRTKFITGQNSAEGLPGYLDYLWQKYGLATVISGQTSIDITDATIAAGDIVIASVMTKGTNAAYVVGVTITAGVKFNIAVNTDPGAGGAVISYIVIRPTS